jgi:hypothetical protein
LAPKAFIITYKYPDLKYLRADISSGWVEAIQEIIYVPGYITTMMFLLRRTLVRSVILCGKRGGLS